MDKPRWRTMTWPWLDPLCLDFQRLTNHVEIHV